MAAWTTIGSASRRRRAQESTGCVDALRSRVLGLPALSKESRSRRRLALSAAAKVNLVLEILGKRADGYHELATVMQAVDLSDRLILEEAADLELAVSAEGVPGD